MEKDYRIMNIVESTIDSIRQKVGVIDISEVEYQTLFTGRKISSFGPKTTEIIVDLHSSYYNRLLNCAMNNEIVTIDLNDFDYIIDYYQRGNPKTYYQKDIYKRISDL